jgi:hypothetical protein
MSILYNIKIMTKIFTITNKKYYLADDVYAMEPQSFVGCSKTSRLMVKNKHLQPENYVYMKHIKSNNTWIRSDENYKKAKLLISEEWMHNNLIQFKEDDEKSKDDLKIEAMILPPLLELKDEEKFTDINGNILDIEVRGTKMVDDIYFCVKDVAENFKLGDVITVLTNKNASYEKNIHYKLFNRIKPINNKKGKQKSAFLTITGLTKLLYCSRSKNAEHFQKWAVY